MHLMMVQMLLLFLSTLSLRRATLFHYFSSLCNFISIHALLAESDKIAKHNSNIRDISIHALLAESDLKKIQKLWDAPISIHALLAESDRRHSGNDGSPVNFYPRSPCGERLQHNADCNYRSDFYPRSPCGERPVMYNIVFVPGKFLSTLSLRRATPQKSYLPPS